MMQRATAKWLVGSAAAVIVAACGGREGRAPAAPVATASASSSASGAARTGTLAPGDVEVLLCDGKTKVNVPVGTPGTSISGSLMTEWLAKHPGSTWEAEERERHQLQPAADNKGL